MDRRDRTDPLTLNDKPITWEEALALPPSDRSFVVATDADGGRYRPFRFLTLADED